jgi:hypothetical protein
MEQAFSDSSSLAEEDSDASRPLGGKSPALAGIGLAVSGPPRRPRAPDWAYALLVGVGLTLTIAWAFGLIWIGMGILSWLSG